MTDERRYEKAKELEHIQSLPCSYLGVGVVFDELREVALVGLELQALDLKDVGAAVVEEARIVRNHDCRHVGQRVDVAGVC
jgi:hypothetical protein